MIEKRIDESFKMKTVRAKWTNERMQKRKKKSKQNMCLANSATWRKGIARKYNRNGEAASSRSLSCFVYISFVINQKYEIFSHGHVNRYSNYRNYVSVWVSVCRFRASMRSLLKHIYMFAVFLFIYKYIYVYFSFLT